MQRIRSEAVLLRSVDFGESDRIVHLLTPDSGRMTAMAKGARRSVKRFAGTLDLFNRLDIAMVRPRRASMVRLEQAKLIDPFLDLRVAPSRFALACYLVELLDRMAPEGGARRDTERLYRFAVRALGLIAHEVPRAETRVLLELRTLDALGLRPQLSHCVRCGKEAEGARIGFDVADGGVVCGPCAAQGGRSLIPLHLGTARSLEQALRLDLAQLGRLSLGPAALGEARELLGRFHRFHLGLELRSEAVLDALLAAPPTVAERPDSAA